MLYNIEVMFKEPAQSIGVFDAVKFNKAMEFIKTKLSAEDYEQLKHEYNFDVYYFDVNEDGEGETK